MKTKRALLLLMLLIAVGCGESERTANLTACPDCGEKVSKRAAACPHCGAPLSYTSLLPPTVYKTIVDGIGMKLTLIPAGTFLMGHPERDWTDGAFHDDQHHVTISKAFYMQTTEVTQGQWKAVMGTEPWKLHWRVKYSKVKEGPNYPVSYLSWNEAVAYCKKLSEIEGKTYRLPTEAEWEYACRAGTKTSWSFGNSEKDLGDYAWYQENAWDIDEKYAHQVELKKPNAFGLYDMHGNVQEWCHDYYDFDYYKQSPEMDPTGPASGSSRVLRGGSLHSYSLFTRSDHRNRLDADDRISYTGLRVVRQLD